MSNLKDLIDYPERGDGLSLAYVLLLANILGMTIFLGQKRSYSPALTEKKETVKSSAEVKNSDDRRESDGHCESKLQLKEKEEQVKEGIHAASKVTPEFPSEDIGDKSKSDIVVKDDDKIVHQCISDETVMVNEDSVIDFKTVVDERKLQGKKEPLKPLVWNFPESSPFFRKH